MRWRRTKVWLWVGAALGSLASGFVGLLIAAAAAGAYERALYPPEPDPVHFDVAGIFLMAWVVVWVAGTAA